MVGSGRKRVFLFGYSKKIFGEIVSAASTNGIMACFVKYSGGSLFMLSV